jgi:osmotically-inducible protein OsmY
MDERHGRRSEDEEPRSDESAPREFEDRRYRGEGYYGGYYQPARSRGVYEQAGGPRERGFLDRARDEVRSWFGDEDAERRRREDERIALRRRGSARGRREDAGHAREGDGPTFGGGRERDDVEARRPWDARAGWLEDRGHGPHSGRGPKGYRRSDERIREDVCDLLCEHGGVDAS